MLVFGGFKGIGCQQNASLKIGSVNDERMRRLTSYGLCIQITVPSFQYWFSCQIKRGERARHEAGWEARSQTATHAHSTVIFFGRKSDVRRVVELHWNYENSIAGEFRPNWPTHSQRTPPRVFLIYYLLFGSGMLGDFPLSSVSITSSISCWRKLLDLMI